jgi:hypothetical protein
MITLTGIDGKYEITAIALLTLQSFFQHSAFITNFFISKTFLLDPEVAESSTESVTAGKKIQANEGEPWF